MKADLYQDLSTKVYNHIQQMILSGELAAGQKLNQENLAELLGVSRTPLLHAISKLSENGLIISIPRRGSFVRTVTTNDIIDVFNIRAELEPLGAELSTMHSEDEDIAQLKDICAKQEKLLAKKDFRNFYELDCQFHLAILEASKNKYLFDCLKNFINSLFSHEKYLKTPADSLKEHLKIIEAIEEKKIKTAVDLMKNHIGGVDKENSVKIILSQKE